MHKSQWEQIMLNHIYWHTLKCVCKMYIFIYFSPIVLMIASSKVSYTRCCFMASPLKSQGDRQAYLQIRLSSCFTGADFVMALNSLNDYVGPKNPHCCFFLSPKERGWDINQLEEKHLFSALAFIALHKKLIGGLFFVRVNFTADCVYWSSHKTK